MEANQPLQINQMPGTVGTDAQLNYRVYEPRMQAIVDALELAAKIMRSHISNSEQRSFLTEETKLALNLANIALAEWKAKQ